MTRLRTFLLAKGPLALWLLAAAFAVRALVPQGYMVAPGAAFALIPCPEVASAAPAAMAHHPGMDHGDRDRHGGSGKGGDGVCAFAPLAQAAAAGADPVLLVAALALAFVAAIVRPATPPSGRRRAYLQPPLRGPPTTA